MPEGGHWPVAAGLRCQEAPCGLLGMTYRETASGQEYCLGASVIGPKSCQLSAACRKAASALTLSTCFARTHSLGKSSWKGPQVR